jgi:hypothetical protein
MSNYLGFIWWPNPFLWSRLQGEARIPTGNADAHFPGHDFCSFFSRFISSLGYVVYSVWFVKKLEILTPVSLARRSFQTINQCREFYTHINNLDKLHSEYLLHFWSSFVTPRLSNYFWKSKLKLKWKETQYKGRNNYKVLYGIRCLVSRIGRRWLAVACRIGIWFPVRARDFILFITKWNWLCLSCILLSNDTKSTTAGE